MSKYIGNENHFPRMGDSFIESYKLQALKTTKGWGSETLICNNPYFCGKILRFNKGNKFSSHFHVNKEEVFFVLNGSLNLTLIDTSNASKHTEVLKAGDIIEIPRHLPHQIEAIEDCEIIEFSTHHEDADSYRVEPGDSQKEKKRELIRKTKIGFITGCFDGPNGLHDGHRYILSEAKKHCDFLYAAINEDGYIYDYKLREPMAPFAIRYDSLERDPNVDQIIEFYSDPLPLIMEIKPDFLFVGSDYDLTKVVGADEIKQWGGQVKIIERLPNISTTELLAKKYE